MSIPPVPESPSRPLHIRLNSGIDDLPEITPSTTNDRPSGASRQESSRSLIPHRPPPLVASAFRNPVSPALHSGHYAAGPTESSERLLPPSRLRAHRFRDDDSPSMSPLASGFSSRRTSFSSEGGGNRDSRPYTPNPFEDSRAPSRTGSGDDNVNTQTVSEKYNILPSAGLLLFPEDVEKDDWLHNPDPNEKEKMDCDIFTKRGLLNIGGLLFLTIGLLILFIGYPILTFAQKLDNENNPCAGNVDCLPGVGKVPLLKNIRTGLIDPDTPQSAMTTTAVDGTELKLVFSDEFNTPGRTFYPNDDPYFTAVDLWYGVTQDLEWYDPDAVTTAGGVLEIRFDAFQNHNLNYRSGMLQSWNQMCFTGGHLETSISLPGAGDTIGFWPGFWSMGNLGRPGYASTTDGLWPYSYDNICDAGITPNQSQPDGLSLLPGMRLPACTCLNEDHPTPGTSRSAPEIDVLEGSVGPLNQDNTLQIGVASQSLQVAPFDIWYQPDYNYIELYNDEITLMNVYRGGPFQQALSGVTNLNNNWYNGNQYQTYAYESVPGPEGRITWFVGQEKTWMMDHRAIRPNGNIGQRVVPQEPMALVMNLGMSNSFAALNLTGLAPLMPATIRFDYVRIYQDPSQESVTCDPPGMETTPYINAHYDAYTNPNLTRWQETPYSWPQNALENECTAADSSVPITRPS